MTLLTTLLAALSGPEDGPLRLGRQATEERQQKVVALQVFQAVQGVVDVPLRGHKDEDVAVRTWGRGGTEAGHRGNGLVHIGIFRFLAPVAGPVFGVDRKAAALDGDDRRAFKMPAETLRIDGGRGDDELEIGTSGQEALQVAQEKIDVQTALMGLVQDNGVVLQQFRVCAGFRQEYAVGHEFDEGIPGRLAVKADLLRNKGDYWHLWSLYNENDLEKEVTK